MALTFIGDTGGITEAAAMTEGLDGGILITERLHVCILPSWETTSRHDKVMWGEENSNPEFIMQPRNHTGVVAATALI